MPPGGYDSIAVPLLAIGRGLLVESSLRVEVAMIMFCPVRNYSHNSMHRSCTDHVNVLL